LCSQICNGYSQNPIFKGHGRSHFSFFKRQHVRKSGADPVAGLIWPFSTFGPLLVLSMNQTRAQKTRTPSTGLATMTMWGFFQRCRNAPETAVSRLRYTSETLGEPSTPSSLCVQPSWWVSWPLSKVESHHARASAPSSVLRPLTPDFAPELGTCCLKKKV
jgi:hypothetical protein